MRLHFVLAIALASAANLAAQKKDTKKPAPASPITLTGCVERVESAPGQFTLSEQKGSQAYRLTGTDVRDYVGRRVQIVGGAPDSRRLKIAGGLTPSPNIAAQAGAMDPSRAVVAAATEAGGPGRVELPEFKVKSVRPISGSCAE